MSDISPVNLIVVDVSLLVRFRLRGLVYLCPIKKMSSIKRFRTVGLKTVLLRIVVSICAIKILAKETAIFVPIAVAMGL